MSKSHLHHFSMLVQGTPGHDITAIFGYDSRKTDVRYCEMKLQVKKTAIWALIQYKDDLPAQEIPL